MWQLVGALNVVIALCYAAITLFIVRGLTRTRQLTSNPLAWTTAFIFFSSALYHGAHALLLLAPFGDDGLRLSAATVFDSWPEVAINVLGAAAAIVYLVQRRRYRTLLRSPSMFVDSTEVRYRQLAGNLPQTTVVVVDREMRYVIAEGDGFAGSGYEPEQIIGKLPREVLPAEQWARSEPYYLAALRGESIDFEQLATSAGRVFRLRLVPMRDEDEVIVGAIIIGEDVTDQVKARQDLEVARDAALEAILMQKNFAASASHELKTPIAAIIGFTEMLGEDGNLTEQNRSYLAVIERNANRLKKLTDDLLILGEAEIGPALMHIRHVALAPLVAHVIDAFANEAQGHNVAIKWDGIGFTVMADPFRLEQAFMNLVSNAVKYSPSGGTIRIVVSIEDDGVHISVRDSGIGIAPEALGKVFDRFYRAKEVIDEQIKGSGLGLSIAQRMIEAQHGTITATSTLGLGSTFTITLPEASEEIGS